MPKAIQVHISEPCHENWQQMTPNEQGRHCLSCQKTVVDFSVMSDKEILNYISNAGSQVCGRFANEQLDKNLVIEKKKKFSFAYIWNLMIATFLVTGKAYTQGDTILRKEVVVQKEPEALVGLILVEPEEIVVPSFVKGMVLNSEGKSPVAGASITVFGAKKGVIAGADGNFHVKWPKRNKSSIIEISAVGYKTKKVNVTGLPNWSNVEILLEPEAFVLDTAFVTTFFDSPGCSYTYGFTFPIVVETRWDKAIKEIFEWMPGKKEVQAYPNPAIKGSTINLKLNLPETGEYKMELMDASGRIVFVKPVLVTGKDQPALLPTNAGWSAGVYWVRMTSRRTKKLYQSKLLIQ